jgi:hypothetical protein
LADIGRLHDCVIVAAPRRLPHQPDDPSALVAWMAYLDFLNQLDLLLLEGGQAKLLD